MPTTTDAMQIAFARLVGDVAARERFAALPESERTPLVGLAARTIDGYARGLLHKRLDDVSRALPRSARAADFRERFLHYAARRPIGGIDRHRLDAIAFARVLGTGIAIVERNDLEALGGERFARIAFVDGRLHWWLRLTRGGRLRRGIMHIGRPGTPRA